MTTPSPPVPQAPAPSGPPLLTRALRVGLLFAVVGLLLGYRNLATALPPNILRPGDSNLDYQEVVDGLPVPRLLNWDLGWIERLLALRDMNPILLGVAGCLLFGALWLAAASLLDPSLRLFTRASGEDDPPAASMRTAFGATLDSAQFFLALRRSIPVGIPLAALWLFSLHLSDAGPSGLRLWLARLLLLGVALWIGYRPPTSPWLPRLAGGALAGIGLFVFWLSARPGLTPALFARFHALGVFNREHVRIITEHYLGSVGFAWFGVGIWLCLVALSGLRPAQRGVLLTLAVGAALAAFLIQRPLSSEAMAARYDTTAPILATASRYDPAYPVSGVPTGPAAGEALANLLHLPMGAQPSQPDRSMALFSDQGILNVRLAGYTENRLTADPATAATVQQFLERRDYETALSWVAIKHCYDVASLQFDPTTALRTALLDLERCPHTTRFSGLIAHNGVLITTFYACSASPENLALLDRWADETYFAYPDRASKLLIGRLYLRFGAKDKALTWFQRADMPRSFLANVRATPPFFHQGQVKGTLSLNGRPLAGVRVGVVPHSIEGLPRAEITEPLVMGAENDLLSGPQDNHDADFPAYHPRPHALRWISAATTTDANGAFALNDLVAGQYLLVCALPSSLTLQPPMDPRLHANHAPRYFALNEQSPTVNLGVIRLTYSPK